MLFSLLVHGVLLLCAQWTVVRIEALPTSALVPVKLLLSSLPPGKGDRTAAPQKIPHTSQKLVAKARRTSAVAQVAKRKPVTHTAAAAAKTAPITSPPAQSRAKQLRSLQPPPPLALQSPQTTPTEETLLPSSTTSDAPQRNSMADANGASTARVATGSSLLDVPSGDGQAGQDDGPRPANTVAHPPVLVFHIRADYPSHARRMGIEGLVRLKAILDREGRIEREIQVLESVPLLDEAAVSSVRQWRFTPARNHSNQPVRVFLEIPIQFVLRW